MEINPSTLVIESRGIPISDNLPECESMFYPMHGVVALEVITMYISMLMGEGKRNMVYIEYHYVMYMAGIMINIKYKWTTVQP